MKILITGGKSAQSLKAVNAYPEAQIVLADYGEVPSFPSARYQFISLGGRNDDVVAHHLLTVCLDYDVNALLPLHQFEVNEIIKSETLFQEFNIQVFKPEPEQIIR